MSGNIFNKQGAGIRVIIKDGEDYLSLTQMAEDCGYKSADAIRNFLSNTDNLRFIIAWEITENPDSIAQFASSKEVVAQMGDHLNLDAVDTCIETRVSDIKAEHVKLTAATAIQKYNITGLYIKTTGSNDARGIYAHHDIALHFATWLNPAYGVFVNKDYQRLKNNELDEMSKRGLKWKFDRRDAATWHRMMKSAVHSVVVPALIDQVPDEILQSETMTDEFVQQTSETLAAEAMIAVSNYINVAVFGMTAQQWRVANPDKKGNMRDYATEDELNLVSYLEYQLSRVIMENPLNRNKWRKESLRIAKRCRKDGIRNMVSMFRGEQEVTPVEPESYDARTLTARKSAAARFKEDLLTGEIQYDKKDNVFRNSEGFICLGWKI